MKSIGTAKEVECTFQFYCQFSNGKLLVFYETSTKGGDRSLDIRTPDTAEEQEKVLEAICRAEKNKHLLKKHKLDRTPKSTNSEGSVFI